MPYADRERRREHHRDYMRRRYQTDADFRARQKAATRRTKARRKEERRSIVQEILRTSACIDFGEADPIVLDFDHVRGPKIANIADLVTGDGSVAMLLAEIEKCEIRCANCHRRRTHERRKAGESLPGVPDVLPLFDQLTLL